MRVRNLAGSLSLLAMLALASPGVHAVRAAPPESGSARDSSPAQCGSEPAPGASDPQLDAFLADLRREELARVGTGNTGVVMLNGRGYNYGPAPQVDLEMLGRIRAERAAAQRP